MSLPTVAQTNVSQKIQNPHYPTGVHLSNRNRTRKNQMIDNFCPPIQHSTNKAPTLFAVHNHSHLIFGLFRNTHLQTTKQPFIPPLLNILANQTFRYDRNKFQIGHFLETNICSRELKYKKKHSHLKHNFNLQSTNKSYIKLPAITIPNFNGNPLKHLKWINNFFNFVHNNSLTDTHRVTYLQNSVVGKAKEKIQAYSCDPAYYLIALKELMNLFGDPSIVVNAFINQLEAWRPKNDYKKQNFVSFVLFFKRLVQAFDYLGFKADMQSSTFTKKAKKKFQITFW